MIHKKFKSLIFIELIIILILFSSIYLNFNSSKSGNVLGQQVYESTINSDDIEHLDDNRYEYYWEYKPSIVVEDQRESENIYAHYSINTDRLNERFNYEVEKPKDTFRIITLGDSFTFGLYVNTEDNWTELLEKTLKEKLICNNFNYFEVVNLGMPGFDIPYMVNRYEDRGIKYNADLIIYFESGSGYTRYNELMQPLLKKCSDNKNVKYNDCRTEVLRRIYEEISLETLVSDEILKSLYDFLVKRENIPVLFISYDSDKQKKFVENGEGAIRNTFFHEIENTFVIDLQFDNAHPNQRGHQVIAEDVFEYLYNNKEDLILCN